MLNQYLWLFDSKQTAILLCIMLKLILNLYYCTWITLLVYLAWKRQTSRSSKMFCVPRKDHKFISRAYPAAFSTRTCSLNASLMSGRTSGTSTRLSRKGSNLISSLSELSSYQLSMGTPFCSWKPKACTMRMEIQPHHRACALVEIAFKEKAKLQKLTQKMVPMIWAHDSICMCIGQAICNWAWAYAEKACMIVWSTQHLDRASMAEGTWGELSIMRVWARSRPRRVRSLR